jgi:hypothetical protein
MQNDTRPEQPPASFNVITRYTCIYSKYDINTRSKLGKESVDKREEKKTICRATGTKSYFSMIFVEKIFSTSVFVSFAKVNIMFDSVLSGI